eukprot:2203128-Alexandrium_andersonii.AAC.1
MLARGLSWRVLDPAHEGRPCVVVEKFRLGAESGGWCECHRRQMCHSELRTRQSVPTSLLPQGR